MDVFVIPVLGILSSLIVLPGIVFLFIYKMKKAKVDVDTLRYKKEILELELRKQQLQLEVLQQENKHMDRKLEQDIGTPQNRDR